MSKESREERRLGYVIAILVIISVAAILLLDLQYDLDLLPFMSIDDPTGEIERILVALIVISVAWLILHFVGRFFEKITLPKVGSHAQVRSVWKLISYAVWIFVLIAIMLSLMGNVGDIAVYIGLMGAAITFVLQKPLLNIGGWALITYRRIIRIGDRVAIGDAKGYVLDIKLMYTELREFGEWMHGDTFTGRIITIPNGVIFDLPVFNYTRDFPFIWDEIVNLVTYESDIEVAKRYMLESTREVIGETMKANYELYRKKLGIRDLEQLLLKEPELRMDLSDSGVNVYILYFCPVEERRKIKSEITERIWKRFMADPNVGIAYPHMQIVGSLDK